MKPENSSNILTIAYINVHGQARHSQTSYFKEQADVQGQEG